MIDIGDKGRPLSAEDIEELERSLDVTLPEAYRSFLLSTNGGRPWPDIVDVPGLPGSPTDVQVLLGIDRDIASENILWRAEFIARDYPAQRLVPVGSDSGGNCFCLQVRDGIASNVVFGDLYGWNAHIPSLYAVAPDFATFLSQLRALAS
ncbi:MAG: SMI1/KNR4 family protein [Rhodospirillales bacterium]|nr:SMI1/KNR4 family protein [Rhodospirillales bacterium]